MGFDAHGRLVKVSGARTPRVAVASDGTVVVNPNNATLRQFLADHPGAVEVVFRDPVSPRRARSIARSVVVGECDASRYGAYVAPLHQGLVGRGTPMANEIQYVRRLLSVCIGRTDAEILSEHELLRRVTAVVEENPSVLRVPPCELDAETLLTFWNRGVTGHAAALLAAAHSSLEPLPVEFDMSEIMSEVERIGFHAAAAAMYRDRFAALVALVGEREAHRRLDEASRRSTPSELEYWGSRVRTIADWTNANSIMADSDPFLAQLIARHLYNLVEAEVCSDPVRGWLAVADELGMPDGMADPLEVVALLTLGPEVLGPGELGRLGADRCRALVMLLSHGHAPCDALTVVQRADLRTLERVAVAGTDDADAFNAVRESTLGRQRWLAYRFGLSLAGAGALQVESRSARQWAALPAAVVRDIAAWRGPHNDAGQLAVRVVDVFGKSRAGQWHDRCRRLGIDAHDAAYWLPAATELDRPSREAFAAYALRHLGASGDPSSDLERLRTVAGSWKDLDGDERRLSPVKLLEHLKAIRSGALAGTSIGAVTAAYNVGSSRTAKAAALWARSVNVPSWVPAATGSAKYGPGGKALSWEFLSRTDATGLFLGEATDCCQSIGQAGSECAVHGQTRPSGAFWVCRDRAGDIVAQAWVWLDRDGNGACFDNVERLEPKGDRNRASPRAKAVRACLEQAAERLVEHGVSTVTLGTGMTAISTKGFQETVPLYPYSYDGYRDSEAQVLVAGGEVGAGPWLKPVVGPGGTEVLQLKVDSPNKGIAAVDAVWVSGDPAGRRLVLEAGEGLDTHQATAIAEWVQRTGQTATATGPGAETLAAALVASGVDDQVVATTVLLGPLAKLVGSDDLEKTVRKMVGAADDEYDEYDEYDDHAPYIDDYNGDRDPNFFCEPGRYCFDNCANSCELTDEVDRERDKQWSDERRDVHGDNRYFDSQHVSWQERMCEFPSTPFPELVPVPTHDPVRLSGYPGIPAELVGPLAAAGLGANNKHLQGDAWGTEPGQLDPYFTVRAVTAGVSLSVAMFGQALGIRDVDDLLRLEREYVSPSEIVERPGPISEITGVRADVCKAILSTWPSWAVHRVFQRVRRDDRGLEAFVEIGIPLAVDFETEDALLHVAPKTHVTPSARTALDDWYGDPGLLPYLHTRPAPGSRVRTPQYQ